MERVTVTITTDKPVSVKITPGKDAFLQLLDTIEDKKERAEKIVVRKTGHDKKGAKSGNR